MTEASPKVVGD